MEGQKARNGKATSVVQAALAVDAATHEKEALADRAGGVRYCHDSLKRKRIKRVSVRIA